jgi:hypothetical protein
MIKILRSTLGISLVESLLAASLAGILIFIGMTTSGILNLGLANTQKADIKYKVISNLVETFTANAINYQKNYAAPSVLTSSILNVTTLPLAASEKYMGPVAGCTNCPIRLGYVLRPVSGYSGMFLATIRYHDVTTAEISDSEILVVLK